MTRTALWLIANYYGSCAGCGADIEPDDPVRADGQDRYLCEECGHQEDGP
jgi:hypothetical protein